MMYQQILKTNVTFKSEAIAKENLYFEPVKIYGS